jgi:hypothetical protein
VDCDGVDYEFGVRSSGQTVTVGSGSARLPDADLARGFGSVRLGIVATGPDGGTATFTGVGGEAVG